MFTVNHELDVIEMIVHEGLKLQFVTLPLCCQSAGFKQLAFTRLINIF